MSIEIFLAAQLPRQKVRITGQLELALITVKQQIEGASIQTPVVLFGRIYMNFMHLT